MRYLVDNGQYDDHTIASIELAETLFERYVGRRLAVERYDERITIRSDLARLPHTPVARIISIKATLDANAAMLPWSMTVDISPNDVQAYAGILVLPRSMFNVSYASANVVYEAGLVAIPTEITKVVEEIAYRIAKGDCDEWSGVTMLSDEAQATIAQYAKGR